MKLLKGLKIQALDHQVNNEPSLTPKLSFSLMLTASKGKGKSSTLINMLINKDMLAGKFNQIHIVSPTNKLDIKFNILKTTPGIIIPNFKLIKELSKSKKMNIVDNGSKEIPEYNTVLTDSDFTEDVSITLLKNIIEEQKYIIETYGKDTADNILIVYDDCASEKRFWNSNSVQKLMFNSRHYKVSLIITTQNYKSIPKSLRLNMSMIVIYYTANMAELSNIYDENNSNLTFKEFSAMFKKVCNAAPYNFLTINYSNTEEFRYEMNFEKFIKT
jgi:hypothetical protein